MKNSYLFCTIFIGVILCSCFKDIPKQSSKGSIVGSISDRTTGEPIATADISINPGGSSTVTGSNGLFSFVNLEPGDYTLSTRKEGYNPRNDNITVEAQEPTLVHINIDRIPASLTVDKCSLDFGENLTTLSFTIVNSGYVDLTYKVEKGSCVWLSVEPETDTLKFEKTATIVVTLDRNKLPNGENEASIVVRSTSGSGNAEVKVTAINNANAAVNTLDVTDVKNTTATLTGEIINAGRPAYTERGFVYDTQPTPTVSANINKLSSPVTSDKKFYCNINGLSPMQTYYARTYIVQNGTIVYGNIVSFTTSQQATTLLTSAVTQIGASTATFNASILNIGVPAYTERGFCYSIKGSPTIADNCKPVSGSGTGDFSLQIRNLEYPTTYYVRAYAIQAGSPVYGNEISFSTSITSAVVSTYAATDITSSSVLLNGSILNIGSPVYSEKGFCYGSYNPTLNDEKVIVSGSDIGNFSARISNLEYNKLYYFRAYAIQEGTPIFGENLYFYTTYTEATVLTSDVTNIKYTSATFNGLVTNIGDPKITEHGFCYTDNGYDRPQVTDKTVKVSGTASGNFKAEMKDLKENCIYYVRAYAIQANEPIYGSPKKFTTYSVPVIVTGPTYDSKSISFLYWAATLQGAFYDGNPSVTDCGFIYSTLSSNVTIESGEHVSSYSIKHNSSLGAYYFKSTINTFIANTTYYYRAYVKTSLGYTYGEIQSFNTF